MRSLTAEKVYSRRYGGKERLLFYTLNDIQGNTKALWLTREGEQRVKACLGYSSLAQKVGRNSLTGLAIRFKELLLSTDSQAILSTNSPRISLSMPPQTSSRPC